jgi:hypothetical protein
MHISTMCMAGLLEITGSSALIIVSPEGGQRISYSISVKNLTTGIVNIDTAYLFVASEGGWSMLADDELISKYNNFFGLNPTISSSSAQTSGPITLRTWYEPISYIIVTAHATNNSEEQDVLSVIKVFRPGFSLPQSLDIQGPVFISLLEPIDVITTPRLPYQPNYLVDPDERRVLITGQMVNGSGREQRIKRLQISLVENNGTAVFQDDIPIIGSIPFVGSDNKPLSPDLTKGNSEVLPKFLFGRYIPQDFSEGKLRVKGQVDVKRSNSQEWEPLKLERSAIVKLAPLDVLRAPVVGYYMWGNGPIIGGPPFWNTHSRPEARYSYDLVALKRDKQTSLDLDLMSEPMVTHYSYSDGSDNSSFFCFNQPIFCMHDGIVIDVIDDVPDNNGLSGLNPLNVDARNAVIVVQHMKGKRKLNRYSKYYHLRQNSAKVQKGQAVTKGEMLGNIGNAGLTGEPHLHVGYFKYNVTGRLRALPMTFDNLIFYAPPEPIHVPPSFGAISKYVKSVPAGDIGLEAILFVDVLLP